VALRIVKAVTMPAMAIASMRQIRRRMRLMIHLV
jgi:hypothetical protein